MKKRIVYITICIIGSVLLVAFMYLASIYNSRSSNGFMRMLPSHKVMGVIGNDIQYNSWYMCGQQGNSIFLGNYQAPFKLLELDSNLKGDTIVSLSGFAKLSLYKGASTQLDSSIFFLMDGLKPIALRTNRASLEFSKQINIPYFTGSIPISANSFALRYVNSKGENVLAKFSIGSDSLKNTNLLEKQIDGIFCTDGEMVKVPGSSKLIYVYYYRNQFLCADSNLNLLYKGKTIDTISHAQIKVAKIKSTGQITMAAPPLYVNKRASANEKYLFIQSALRANNETEYMIKDVSMIDVYAIKDGKYQFSFYLPDFKGNKIRDFKVYGRSLYALYDHYLYKYQLNF